MAIDEANDNLFVEDLELSSNGSGASAYLFVALYLVILAFFILLNSISVIKVERDKDILEGVRGTFSDSFVDHGTHIFNRTNTVGKEVVLQDYASRIAEFVEESVAMIRAKVENNGNITEIHVPTEIFFYDNSSQIRIEQMEFMENLGRELLKLKYIARIDSEFVISGDSADEFANHLAIARASSFATKLVDVGVSENSLLIGVDYDGSPGEFIIKFYLRFIDGSDSVYDRPI